MEKPNSHSDTTGSKSGGDHVKVTELTLGDLTLCPDELDYQTGNRMGRGVRSQPRP